MKKYFHKLKKKEYEELMKSDKTIADVMEEFSQPDWCNYPEALAGEMGCWSLVFRHGVSKKYCKNCDCFYCEK